MTWHDFQLVSKVRYGRTYCKNNHKSKLFVKRKEFGFYLQFLPPASGSQAIRVVKFELGETRVRPNEVSGILNLIFPYIPDEFLQKECPPGNTNSIFREIKSISVSGQPIKNIQDKLRRFNYDTDGFDDFYNSPFSSVYKLVLSELEQKMLTEVSMPDATTEQLDDFLEELKNDVKSSTELLEEINKTIKYLLDGEKIAYYYNINEFFRNKYKKNRNNSEAAKEILPTCQEYYERNKDWAFVSNISPNCIHYYQFPSLKNETPPTDPFLASEIFRLQQIGLTDFVMGRIPVKIEFDIQDKPMALLPQPTGIQRFLTAEDVREILDGGAKSVFNDDELKDLLAEPDPARFTSSMELGMAYDWAGKFAEAKAELEKDTTPLGRFELGRFLMAGRPGIPADRDRANSILEKLVNDMEDRLDREEELSAEECILAGKACHEIRPRRSTQWAHWVELGDEFFQQAIELGERAGHYYIQYYRRTKPGKKLEEMWKALPTNDIEARAGLAAYAGHVQQFRKHLNQEQHLRDLKSAVQARCNRAQYWLGLLYSLNVGTQQGKYLKHSNEKARFWLKRAAERGDQDAQFLLGTMSPQSP